MAGKTPTELVRELSLVVARLEERTARIQADSARVEATLARLGEDSRDAQVRLKVAEGKLDDVKRETEEAERRRWQLWVVGVAAVLSLVGNLVLTFARNK